MDILILWIAFVGSWLLFAGPIYQAALELSDENLEIDKIRLPRESAGLPPRISVYWWFLPPIKLYLEQRRSSQYRKYLFQTMDTKDAESLMSFLNKATGWLLVAIGGLFIATKETYELSKYYEISPVVFTLVILIMALISISFTVINLRKIKKVKLYLNEPIQSTAL